MPFPAPGWLLLPDWQRLHLAVNAWHGDDQPAPLDPEARPASFAALADTLAGRPPCRPPRSRHQAHPLRATRLGQPR